ncbi:MAG TPA: hypothetical protein VER12_06255 [Polyangiaceae bacterium]|nr:hypothetical protein [Polyangiaceae bacterium]
MIRIKACAGLTLSALLFGCSGSSGGAAPARPAAAPSAAVPSGSGSPTAAAPPSKVDREAERTVARALKYVSALRELEARGPVNGRVISRDEMVHRVEHSLDTEIPPAVVGASGEILFALGTVPASYDYRTGLLAVMRSELLGFYEPSEKTMFLGGDLHGQELDATLWHELVHALQDQHYDLGKLLGWSDDAGDWQGAVHALAEGDATSAMLDGLFADKGMHAPDVPDSVMDLQGALSAGSVLQVPPIVKRSVVAPYLDGLAFVNALRRRGGWAAVDAAWQHLPTSTEQILHLDKYDAKEAPQALPALPPNALGPTQVTYSDVYGEQTLRILFEEWMPARAAREAASGWAGDRVSSFSDGVVTSVAWHIRYDSEAAAVTALRAFARGALAPEDQAVDARGRLSEPVSAREAEQATQRGQVCRERHTRGPFAVLRRGRDLAVTLGPYRRSPAGALSDGQCKAALNWAAALMTQP